VAFVQIKDPFRKFVSSNVNTFKYRELVYIGEILLIIDTHKNDDCKITNVLYYIDRNGELIQKYQLQDLKRELFSVCADFEYIYIVGGYLYNLEEG